MARPVHFEIHASDLKAAADFYSNLFGWKLDQYGDYPYLLVDSGEGPGINGAIMQRQGPAPAEDAAVTGATIIMSVDDIDASTLLGLELGGSAPTPKQAVPGIGWSAYLKDPDGNLFGLFQDDTEAK